MARQPVFNAELKAVAYRLLYRYGDERPARLGACELSAQALLSEYTAVFESGSNKCLPAHLSLPDAHFQSPTAPALPTANLVLEIDTRNASSDHGRRRLAELLRLGYRIALRDFYLDANTEPLLSLAIMVKLNLATCRADSLPTTLLAARALRLGVGADNIDTLPQLERCLELGFDTYAGGFLSHPRTITNGGPQEGSATALQLLAEIQDPAATPASIENIVQQDPALTYRLLRIVNSAAFSVPREVTAVADTIVLLGFEQVRLLALTISMRTQSTAPIEMFRSLLVRSRWCEIVAQELGLHPPSRFFLAGLMSGMHLMLDIPRDTLLRQMSLAPEIHLAITAGIGQVGEVLQSAINYETGAWGQLPPHFDVELYERAYRASIAWTCDVMAATHGA